MPDQAETKQIELIDYLDVLVVCSAPVDVRPPLNLVQELANFEDVVRQALIPIRLCRVFPPTFEQLQRELSPNALRRWQPKVFYFLGHGEEDGLWFETEEGAGERIPAVQLQEVLHHTSIRLALFNACWSATSRVVSLCEYLTQEGAVATAIGHGQPIADESAIAFARRFYMHITQGLTVGEACQSASTFLAERGLAGSQEVELRGNRELRLDVDLAPGERMGWVENGMPRRGFLPGGGSFCGRAEEFLKITRTLVDQQQCAFGIWGLGGIGKTALALEVARRNAWRYRDGGVVWVDVRDISPPSTLSLLQGVLSRLVPGADMSDPVFGLVRHLDASPGLIVLDNLETLPESEHALLARFVGQVPRNGSRVLLTARTPIGAVEALSDTQSLTLTQGLDDWNGAHYVYRVAQTKDIKALQVVPRESKGRIEGPCASVSRRVSGHPKMIALAVGMARNGMEALDQALAGLGGELEAQLNELLATGLRLVGKEGRRLLTCLPFFPTGRFMLEEMRVVCEAVARARVKGRPDEQGGATLAEESIRLWMDIALRQLERSALLDFDQDAQLYTFHQTLYDHLLRKVKLKLKEREAGTRGLMQLYATYLRDNWDNYPALDRCATNVLRLVEFRWRKREETGPGSWDIDAILASIIDSLGYYFLHRGLWQSGDQWLKRAIELHHTSPAAKDDNALAGALYVRGILQLGRGDPEAAREMLTESAALHKKYKNARGLAACLHQLAQVEFRRGSPTKARRLLRRSLQVLESLGDKQNQGACLQQLAKIEIDQGHVTEARCLLQQAYTIFDALGNQQWLSNCLHELGLLELSQGNLTEARWLLQQSRTMKEKINDRHGLAASLNVLASIEVHASIEAQDGNLTEARRLLQQSRSIAEAIGAQNTLATSLRQLATIEALQGDPTEARRLGEMALMKAGGDIMERAASLCMLAQVEATEGNVHKGLNMACEAVALYRGIGAAEATKAQAIRETIEVRIKNSQGEVPAIAEERVQP